MYLCYSIYIKWIELPNNKTQFYTRGTTMRRRDDTSHEKLHLIELMILNLLPIIYSVLFRERYNS